MAFVTVAGCTRMGTELYQSSFAARLRGTTTAERTRGPDDSVQLTSAAMPALAFANVTTAAPDDATDDATEAVPAAPASGPCPTGMVSIEDRYCIDKYEAALVEVLPNGDERAWPYYASPDKLESGHTVRAISEKGVFPQGYISGKQAAAACRASGKRLCKPAEWKLACKGPDKLQYGYGARREPGTCNDNGRSPIGKLFAAQVANGTAYSKPQIMNAPELNQLAGTLAETGSHEGCTNGYGVYDMVGNIHEWVDDPSGSFQGGYYLDVQQNGEGCGYRTDAHQTWYHDYSTGFRCCADVE